MILLGELAATNQMLIAFLISTFSFRSDRDGQSCKECVDIDPELLGVETIMFV